MNLDTGGGLFTLRVEKAPGVPLADTPVYVFSPSGSYLGITAQTSAQGEVGFALAAGWYRFRVDHMGYQFWCDALEVPNTLSHTMSIPHSDTTITVSTFYTAAVVPLEGVKVYLFTEAGSYQNLNATTNAQGQVTFAVPDQGYKVRVDYLGGQYWSEVFQWQDREVVIDEGMVDLHVTWNAVEVANAPVYLFTETGTYLSRSVSTDPQGHAQFQVPVKPYKFRIDYNGQQYWTSVITPIAHQDLPVDVSLEQLALMPTNNPNPKRYDGEEPIYKPEPIRVASLGSLMGILSQTVVAQVSQPKVYYCITDHLGTPQKVVDAAGAVVWSGDYRPFGEVSSGVSIIQNTFRFPGQYFDAETSLHYNYHRYYQPRVGRYLQADPVGLTGKSDIYSYAAGNPNYFVDFFGEYVEVGIRYFYPVPVFIKGAPLYHCFVRFNGDNTDTLSFDNKGVHKDPAASRNSPLINLIYNIRYSQVKRNAASQDERPDAMDDCVRNEMSKCSGYNMVGSNCCDCVRDSLSKCNLQLDGVWPNMGI